MRFTVALLCVLVYLCNPVRSDQESGSMECSVTSHNPDSTIPVATEHLLPMTGSDALYWKTQLDNFPASVGSPAIGVNTAIITLHGSGRDAADYHCKSTKYLFVARDRSEFVVVSPRFAEETDVVAASTGTEYAYWDSKWRDGDAAQSASGATYSSFDVIDEIVSILTDATAYPDLKLIVFTGHSAGGQVAQRYAVANSNHESLVAAGYTVRYAGSNPSSYTYFDNKRINEGDLPTGCSGAYCVADDIRTDSYMYNFEVPNVGDCSNYNDWRMGLDEPNQYVLDHGGVTAVTERFPARQVLYLIGTEDICNDALCGGAECDDYGMGTGCDDMLQGTCRFMRAHIFNHHIRLFYATKVADGSFNQEIVEMPAVGHSSSGTFKSSAYLQYALALPEDFEHRGWPLLDTPRWYVVEDAYLSSDGYATKEFTGSETAEDCQLLCESETEFTCYGFNFEAGVGCTLLEMNIEIRPHLHKTSASRDMWVRTRLPLTCAPLMNDPEETMTKICTGTPVGDTCSFECLDSGGTVTYVCGEDQLWSTSEMCATISSTVSATSTGGDQTSSDGASGDTSSDGNTGTSSSGTSSDNTSGTSASTSQGLSTSSEGSSTSSEEQTETVVSSTIPSSTSGVVSSSSLTDNDDPTFSAGNVDDGADEEFIVEDLPEWAQSYYVLGGAALFIICCCCLGVCKVKQSVAKSERTRAMMAGGVSDFDKIEMA